MIQVAGKKYSTASVQTKSLNKEMQSTDRTYHLDMKVIVEQAMQDMVDKDVEYKGEKAILTNSLTAMGKKLHVS